jgi:hypothetical protein
MMLLKLLPIALLSFLEFERLLDRSLLEIRQEFSLLELIE